MGRREVSVTEDGRWIVVDGRRWRREDPELPEDAAARLRSHLGRARAAVRTLRRAPEEDAGAQARLRAARDRVGLAKLGLGERGTPWWEQTPEQRRTRWTDALERLDATDAAGGA